MSGIGGSMFVSMTAAATVVWYRDEEVTLALGVTGPGRVRSGPEGRSSRGRLR